MRDDVRRIILHGLKIFQQNKWLEQHAVVIEGHTIKAIVPNNMIKHHLPALQHEFPANYYLAPGFIDVHIHGLKGHDVMDGTEDAINHIRQALAEEGVTGFLATTMTSSNEKIEHVLTAIKHSSKEKIGANIFGVHLEGPFIANTKLGAHVDQTQHLNINLIRKWQALSQNLIRKVTFAPELPNAIDFIAALNEMQIIASIGHTNASFAETQTAINAGCNHATHLFNAMRGLHQRDPGVVGAILLAEQVYAELIVDGYHLHPAIVELLYKIKGKDHLSLVTDAMRAKCMPDGEYDLGGQAVLVKEGRAATSSGVIAGSTLSMPQAIKNMQQYVHCSLTDALQMATYNPARELGLSYSKGYIDAGKDADIVVMDDQLNVKLTMVDGKIVFQA